MQPKIKEKFKTKKVKPKKVTYFKIKEAKDVKTERIHSQKGLGNHNSESQVYDQEVQCVHYEERQGPQIKEKIYP